MFLPQPWRKTTLLASLLLIALLLAGGLFGGLLRQVLASNEQTLNFKPISGPIPNPLMGWAPWATLQAIPQPHSLVYADLTWRDFEPQRGVYDFDSFEKKAQLARWRAENVRVVFRFVCDRPGSQAHLDIPDWLYQAIQGQGDTYDTVYGKGFSPDYTNPALIQYHQEAIHALGERYGQDGFFAYVELGSLGHWGEWHVLAGPGLRPLPGQAIRDQYVRHYVEAFPNTPLLMRRPFAIAGQLNLGLYNDVTGDPAGTQDWLDWIANGGEYDQTGEPHALVAMPEAWMTAPVGGEQTMDLSNSVLYGPALQRTLRLLADSHATFVGPNGPAEQPTGGPLQSGIDRALEHMGYRIYIQQARLPYTVYWGKSLPITLTFANAGAAPMYASWPARIYLYDQRGEVVKTVQPVMDPRKILPGRPYQVTASIPVEGLENGFYTLGFAILDPLTGQPGVRLAMENPRGDLVQEIGGVEINRIISR